MCTAQTGCQTSGTTCGTGFIATKLVCTTAASGYHLIGVKAVGALTIDARLVAHARLNLGSGDTLRSDASM